MIINHSDIELIKKYTESEDEKYLLRLYQKYVKHITAICYNYLGKYDYHQDAAIEIYSKLKAELLKKEFTEKSKFVSWLSVVVKNHCISHLRKLNSIDRTKNQYELHLENVEFDEYERNNIVEASILKEAILSLKEKQQKCILYFYFRGYKITQEVIDKLSGDKIEQADITILKANMDKEFRGRGFFFDYLKNNLSKEIQNDTIIKIVNYAFFSEKMTYKEISNITGFPLEKVKSYIQNGKLNLKKSLQDKFNRDK